MTTPFRTSIKRSLVVRPVLGGTRIFILLLMMTAGLFTSADAHARTAAPAHPAIHLPTRMLDARQQQQRETISVNRSMNVRGGPGLDHPVVRTLSRGQRVTLGPRNADGWSALYEGASTRPAGYVFRASENLRAQAPRADAPRAQGPRTEASTQRARPAPSGASARCRDGTYSYSRNRRGTCSHHGGVREWL